ncbi:cupredoxin domain-containing protein [Salmonella enterica]|uniref:Cupredoxin domain-containing protein n=1 Tax=Salmonella enterica I TaxID=59201 RepID=A0A403QPH5_SALET|nr:cupredoxin domain-containing protein [Salmonella enterica]EAS0615817.1 cupredoxin domain-containing protein [Salmonella enterica subsp. enterica serovar Dahomey]EBQ9004813.1 cupredoxin domain-containing protein [Salmonella enterica subsp. enterica serovar Blockley]ECD6161888.1 cupredoxin domain-containing protein [Salmonella enterica subsp. enterica]ECU7994983.1 cupredoxin domain-containing protein [Salmonella enterica subsp. enterica serovar Toucra]MML56623.1 cupredoxin domain-containing p
MRILLSFLLVFAGASLPISSYAAEKVSLELEMKNGDFIPPVLEVPESTAIRIKVTNTGQEPAEFESIQLRKEKVLAPGASSVVVIAPLKPGTYTFFDDFHLSHPKGEIIVRQR